MFTRKLLSAAFVAVTLGSSSLVFGQSAATPPSSVAADGVVKVKSAYGMDETIARIKDDISSSLPPTPASSFRRRHC
jgi:hypothetical protein